MNINDVFPSDYLKANDLKGRKVKVTIQHVEVKKIGDDTKPVIYFDGKDKGLVLNKTNGMVIAAAYGPETEGWQGRSIFLYSAKVPFQGQMVDALRVEAVPEVSAGTDDPPF